MNRFTIDQNDNGYHIHGIPYYWEGNKITALYQTCQTYDDAIKWLDDNYPNNYEIVR